MTMPAAARAAGLLDTSDRVSAWVMYQQWHNLLFAHWPLPPEVVRPRLPAGVELDTFDGHAWIGVIPFHMTGVRFRWLPLIPTASAFAELNVRTYVRHRGRPGVWFFSLDAESTLAVIGARVGAALPYYRAAMHVRLGTRTIDYRSERVFAGGTPAVFEATYWPDGWLTVPSDGSLDQFLTERYSLFCGDNNHLWRIDIEHPQWELYPAAATIHRNTMLAAAGLEAPAVPALLRFAARQDVRFSPLIRVQ